LKTPHDGISSEEIMTIRYSNGQAFEAALLTREENQMRIVLQGSEDVLELQRINGTWITDECEPVQVEFAWTRQSLLDTMSEDECICSPELAAKLLHLLFSGENESTAKNPAAGRMALLPVHQHVV
jgi:hypothetical protein